MQRKIFSLALCLMAALTLAAQEEAAPEKAWKFDGTVGLNAAATGLVNWAAGGKNNMNGFRSRNRAITSSWLRSSVGSSRRPGI